MALANSSGEKYPELHLSEGVKILQSSDPSCITSLADSRSLSNTPHFAPAAKQLNHRSGARVMLVSRPPITLLIVFHASRLECLKSMKLTVSDQ